MVKNIFERYLFKKVKSETKNVILGRKFICARQSISFWKKYTGLTVEQIRQRALMLEIDSSKLTSSGFHTGHKIDTWKCRNVHCQLKQG